MKLPAFETLFKTAAQQCCRLALAAMPFTVATFGDESRPYARVTAEELIALSDARGVEITVKCARSLRSLCSWALLSQRAWRCSPPQPPR